MNRNNFNSILHRHLLNRAVLLLMSLTLLFGAQTLNIGVLAQESACPAFELSPSLKEKEQLSILVLQDQELRETSPQKVIEAIQQIGNFGRLKFACSKKPTVSNESIIALTNLLDFRREQKVQDNSDVLEEFHIIEPEDFYPAIDALISIGDTTLPALLKVIKGEEVYSRKTENALLVITFFYRSEPPKAVDYLNQEAAKAESDEARQRLLWAANKLSGQL